MNKTHESKQDSHYLMGGVKTVTFPEWENAILALLNTYAYDINHCRKEDEPIIYEEIISLSTALRLGREAPQNSIYQIWENRVFDCLQIDGEAAKQIYNGRMQMEYN